MERKAQNFVTICTRILESKTSEELDDLDALIFECLGNYEDGTVQKIDALNLIHFASMNVIKGHNEKEPSYILFELTVDGDSETVIKEFVSLFPEELIKIYKHANRSLQTKADITRQLIDDQFKINRSPIPSFFEAQCLNGLPFSGTSGLDLNDTSDDSIIAEYAQKIIQEKNAMDASSPKSVESSGQGNEAPNRPLDIFKYVKKSIVEQTDNFELSHSWKRAVARKQSPNFAESMGSDWKENWNQFKFFASIVPAWIWALIASIYFAVLMLLTNQDRGSSLDLSCPTWNKVRYTGSPFFKPDAKIPMPDCIALEPFFLIEGLIFSVLLFAVLRYSPIATKLPSVALTLLTGMAVYLLWPQVFDINQLNNSSASELKSTIIGLLLGLAGLYVVLFIVHKIPKAGGLRGFFLTLAKLFNRFHQWISFFLAIGLCLLFLFMGVRFFSGNQLGGIFGLANGGSIPGNNPNLGQIGYTFGHKFCFDSSGNLNQTSCLSKAYPLPTQFLFIPIVLAGIFTLSVQAIFAHTPRAIKRNLDKLVSSKVWLALFFFTGFAIFIVGFVDSMTDLSVVILSVSTRVVSAMVAALICTHIYNLLSPLKMNLRKVFINFSIVWVLLLFSDYLITPVALGNYIHVFTGIPITIVITALLILFWLGLFLRSQNKNQQRYDNPYTDITKTIFDRENKVSQNHMISIQRLIPDGFRKYIALPLMLHAIYGVLVKQRFRPGFLANVGTVHSARWVHLPETDNYVFLGNYDGSFESYLEDFSKMAIQGTNLAWGNCIGFPKIKGIFKGGVEDSDRFKRYARRSMKPTSFWYSAVTDKSAEQIRRNALIRDGLTQDNLSASEAQAWLDLFGSIPRPEWVLETDEIQNIMFGGNGSLGHGACFALKQNSEGKPLSPLAISEWVDKIRRQISFSEDKQTENSVYVAFSALGLRALGLADALDEPYSESEHNTMPESSNPEYSINFSQPFVSGMADPTRQSVLGDFGESDPQRWRWSDKDVHAVLLVFAKDDHALNRKFEDLKPDGTSGLILELVKTFKEKSSDEGFDKEPFGFADGISQPILKGTARGRKNAESIHLVEPGEFILGYRDNRGHFPPSPVIDAKYDISGYLPNRTTDLIQRYPNFSSINRSSQRSLGRNGSYLVIRELLQDVTGFHQMAQDAATALVTQKVMSLSPVPELAPRVPPAPTVSQPVPMSVPLSAPPPVSSPSVSPPVSPPQIQTGAGLTQKEQDDVANYTEWVEALLMGRHKDGTSLIDKDIKIEQNAGEPITMNSIKIDPNVPRSPQELKQENEFLFKDTDPQGHKCPFGSHVRRANPRDGLMLDSKEGLAVSQRHRILRRGRSYGNKEDEEQGIFFVCLNADIDRQFEFLQQTWLFSSKFHGLRNEIDPIVGQAKSPNEDTSYFTIQHPDGDIRIPGMKKFVTMKGGGYFFMPGKSCLDFFASLKDTPIQKSKAES